MSGGGEVAVYRVELTEADIRSFERMIALFDELWAGTVGLSAFAVLALSVDHRLRAIVERATPTGRDGSVG